MAIDFAKGRWERIKSDAAKWWSGELKRPLIQMVIEGRDPGRREPAIPAYGFIARYDEKVTPEQIADRFDYDLSRLKYMGDAFPAMWINFGAGVMAAFQGCHLSADDKTVWFSPPREMELSEIQLKYEPENKWFKRISAVMEATGERFGNSVQVGMTDIGGTLDILSSFRPSERLLLDLVDDPETVDRLVVEVHELWHKYFAHFDAILRKNNPGWSCWTSIFSSKPYYMFQCDFCYMIGLEMFNRFVKEDLAGFARKLPHAFYHLDGIGELTHLDSILSIKELKGVQWIPGDGKPHAGMWPEVINKIRAAGKRVQVFGGMEVLDAIAEKTGSVEGVCLISQNNYPPAKEKEVERFLLKYGCCKGQVTEGCGRV